MSSAFSTVITARSTPAQYPRGAASTTCFGRLDAPVQRVNVADIHIPFSPQLEKHVLLKPADVIEAVKRVLAPTPQSA